MKKVSVNSENTGKGFLMYGGDQNFTLDQNVLVASYLNVYEIFNDRL